MLRSVSLLALALRCVQSLPGPKFPKGFAERPCEPEHLCTPPDSKYSAVLPIYPRQQWNDAGGYCGSESIQTAVMGKGAWISEQQVRNYSFPGGGHDNEILATNIDKTLVHLKVQAEGFDYKTTPTPQKNAYLKWLKKQIVSGHPIAWMIMLGSEAYPPHYPVYPGLPYGFYSHVEPMFAVFSNHPLSDEEWYEDDYFGHGTNGGPHTYYRRLGHLTDNLNFTGNCKVSLYPGCPCVYEEYGFAWAMQDLLDPSNHIAMPASLRIDGDKEPDTRSGHHPTLLHGHLTVTDLTQGQSYAIYRWNSVESAFDYANPDHVHKFTSTGDSYTFSDPNGIHSNGVAYYRAVVQ